MRFLRYLPAIFYETPGGGGAGASTPATQGQPAQQGQPQPAPGQGQPQGFRQTFFPNVPDDQWGVIEPHMQNINRHVDQLQQTYAPLKGMTPQAIQGLAAFSQQFDQDPVGQWIGLARALQERGIVDPDVDLDYLAAIAAGQEPPEDESQVPNGLDPNNPLTAIVTALQKQVEELSGGIQQERQTTQQRSQDIALERQLSHLKGQLTEAGFPEEALSKEFLLSTYIAHRGNLNTALESITGLRNQLLTGFVQDPRAQQQQQRQNGSPPPKQDLDLPNGSPPPPRGRTAQGPKRGMFAGVEAAAEQALRNADR